jgi:hypothetical protein
MSSLLPYQERTSAYGMVNKVRPHPIQGKSMASNETLCSFSKTVNPLLARAVLLLPSQTEVQAK